MHYVTGLCSIYLFVLVDTKVKNKVALVGGAKESISVRNKQSVKIYHIFLHWVLHMFLCMQHRKEFSLYLTDI